MDWSGEGFYQLFGLSFWRHPFTYCRGSCWASDAVLGQPEGEYICCKFSFLCELFLYVCKSPSSKSIKHFVITLAQLQVFHFLNERRCMLSEHWCSCNAAQPIRTQQPGYPCEKVAVKKKLFSVYTSNLKSIFKKKLLACAIILMK